jgi:hypothetical protein
MLLSTQSKSDIKNAITKRTFSYELRVASAAEAVKSLRFAPMNSANYKTVRFALDCLPRYGSRIDKSCLRSSESRRFPVYDRYYRTVLDLRISGQKVETMSAMFTPKRHLYRLRGRAKRFSGSD